MKFSFIVKIGVGFVILLLAMLSMYMINLYSQKLYSTFEKDYNIFQKYSSDLNQMFQTQSVYFIEFNSAEHNRLSNVILRQIRTDYPKMLDTNIYKKSKDVQKYVDIIQNTTGKFVDQYQNFLNEIQTFGLVRMTYQNEILTHREILIRKTILDRIEYYINGAQLIKENLKLIYKSLDKEKKKIDNLRFFLTNTSTLLGILLSLIASILLLFRVRKSLLKLTKYVGKIASGDFTAKIELNTNDEIQQLAENIKNIISFKDILIKIKLSTKTLEDSYMKINQAVDNINTIAKNQEKSVENASQSFEKLSLSLNEITKNSLETKNITLDTQNKTQTSTLQIRDTISEINLLSNFANKIMGTVKIINSITEQTELLSLNAAIEAAKAGGAGKGFAVVAIEIGKLAETSTKATEEISMLAEEIIDKIKRTTSKSEVSIEALKVIETSIEEVSDKVQDIANITEQKSKRSKEILEEVIKIRVIKNM